MSRFAKTIQLFDNLSNPILVKELRQAVKGKFLIIVLGLILTIQLLMWWMFTLPDTIASISGEQAYYGLLGLFGISLAVCMPLYTGWRILVERANQDLLYVSALSPFQIIWGKFLASAGIIFIVFSTFLPFFYLTLLLGGIDTLTITYTLLITLMALLTMVTFSIFVLCGVVPIVLKVFLVLCFFAGNIYIGVFGGVSTWIYFETIGVPAEAAFSIFLSWMIGGALVNGLLIVLSAAIISPSSSNRAVVPRIYTTFMVFAGLATFAIVARFSSPYGAVYPPGFFNEIAYVAAMTILPFAGLIFLISASGRFKYGLRLRKVIPASFIKKILWFPFYSGAVNGIVWSLFFVCACFGTLIYLSYQSAGPGFFSLDDLRDPDFPASLYHLFSYANYVAIYVWLGMLIHMKTEKLTPLVWTIFLFGGIGLITITSYLSFFQTFADGEEKIAFVLLPNAPAFFNGFEITIMLIISSVFNVLLFIYVFFSILLPQFLDYFSAHLPTADLLGKTTFADASMTFDADPQPDPPQVESNQKSVEG